MSKASIELYSALTTLGLDPQHATRAAEAVEGLDAATRIEVRVHSILLGIIMAFMLAAIWQAVTLHREVAAMRADLAALTRLDTRP